MTSSTIMYYFRIFLVSNDMRPINFIVRVVLTIIRIQILRCLGASSRLMITTPLLITHVKLSRGVYIMFPFPRLLTSKYQSEVNLQSHSHAGI